MRKHDRSLIETDIRSADSVIYAVRPNKTDERGWLDSAPVCPLLTNYQILHLGVGSYPPPFEIVRLKLGGSYFLASLSGLGEVLVDGRWQPCAPHHAFLLPPGTFHAFRSRGERPWQFVWVRYNEQPDQVPIVAANSPVLASFDERPLHHAVLGFYEACQVGAANTPCDLWLSLIQSYVAQFARPHSLDRRLVTLWTDVEADLSRPWSNSEMASRVHLSEKQLERLCRQGLGRTPRQQLIWLRMRRAAQLLRTTDLNIEMIARKVGYQNPFVFSTTFKRCFGLSPSFYPGHP